ncbi:MAG: TetR/AcrR family transcriptional regulator [Caldilineaceae bacterium]
MRQEIIQAAQQLLQSKGADGLSMRAIARMVHTSPANLYEYFLNKEEIIFSVYIEILASLFAHLQQVEIQRPARTYLISLCMHYLAFTEKDPTQIQIVDRAFRVDSIYQGQEPYHAQDSQSHVAATTPAEMAQSQSINDPTLEAYIANKQNIFNLFLHGTTQFVAEERMHPSSPLSPNDIAHVLWRLSTGSPH